MNYVCMKSLDCGLNVPINTHRAILFLPNPGYHPWSDHSVPSTSRWWCLQQYTYSGRISLWSI